MCGYLLNLCKTLSKTTKIEQQITNLLFINRRMATSANNKCSYFLPLIITPQIDISDDLKPNRTYVKQNKSYDMTYIKLL